MTLSACQTGLGDIDGEGVFGLQRGFKKAGANTLLMSLWSVNDDATEKLMTRFYENLFLRRMSKYDSLQDAQQHLRSLTDTSGAHPYAEPKYWAGWILLDALN